MQARLKAAHKKYAEALLCFCLTLGEASEQRKEYVNQRNARNSKIQDVNKSISAFLLEDLNGGSIGVPSSGKSGSHRFKKGPGSGSTSDRSIATLSFLAKVRLEIRKAEADLRAANGNEHCWNRQRNLNER